MRHLFILFSLFSFTFLTSAQPSNELLMLRDKTLHDPILNSYIHQFPFQDYEICYVKNLGSFYVDDIPDGIKGHLWKGIYWESNIGRLINQFTQPNTIAIDMGAHIGIHSLTMSRKVGPNGLVIAFEPQLKIYRELYQNLLLNQCDHNVISLRNAVGEVEKMTEMNVGNPLNEGGCSIGKGGDLVYMVTLDSLNLNNVSLIKMDVETYELNVLKGARETLLRNKPVLIFEILGGYDLDNCTGEIKEKYDSIINFLTHLGYQVIRIHGNDFLALQLL